MSNSQQMRSQIYQTIIIHGFESNFIALIDTTRQIAVTLYFSLTGVDALHSKDLRCVFFAILGRIGYNFRSGVDLVAETLTG